MADGLQFRDLEESDTKRLPELFEETLNDGKDAAYWHWKYFQNPAGKPVTRVACDGPRLVGNIGFIPIRMKVGTDTILASQGVDTTISSAYRQKTTFFSLTLGLRKRMLERGVCFTYVFSNKTIHSIITQSFGFFDIYSIIGMKKILNPTPYLKETLRMGRLSNPLGFVCREAIKGMCKTESSVPPGLRICEIKRFDARFDSFWAVQAKMYEIAVVRDSSYLNWRYIDSPFYYKVFCIEAEQDKSIKGFIVLGCYEEGVSKGRIVDIMAETGDEQIIKLLLTKAINYFIDKGVDIITCWMIEQWPIFDYLKKGGFKQRKTGDNLIACSYSTDFGEEYLSDSSRWYITMGDSDYH